MTSVKKLFVLATLASSISFTGCGNDSTSTVNKPQNISNTPAKTNTSQTLEATLKKYDWQLRDAKDGNDNNIAVLTNLNKKNTRLSFTGKNGKELYFDAGCNTYAGGYTLSSSNELTSNSTLTTKKYCAELDSAEKKLAELINQKNQIILTQNGTKNTLTMITSNDNKLVWEPKITPAYITKNTEIASNLRKYNWVLESASQTHENLDLSSLEKITELEAIKDKVKININGDMLGYTTGCHQQSTNFELANKAILKLSNLSSNVMSCNTNVQAADNILDQIMQQDTKITMLMGEPLTFTQVTSNPNERAKFLTWKALDKSKVDLNTSIDQFNWKLTNALKQNSPVDSYLSTIPELVDVKDKITLGFSFTPAHISYFDNRIRYSAGCNSYTGKFVIDQTDALNVSNVQMTEKACANATASAETMLNDIMKKGGKLVMTMDNAVPTLKFTTENSDSSFETLVWQGTVK